MKLPTIFIVAFSLIVLFFNTPLAAQSQCVGLTNSQCKSNSSCSWRKSSVNKNNVKTKAHCRALPNKGKSTTKKKTSTKKESTKKSSSKKKTTSSSKKKTTTSDKSKNTKTTKSKKSKKDKK